MVKAAGYVVSKPKAKAVKRPLGLNAVGKPYGANYDPKYKLKNKSPRVAYGVSTAGLNCKSEYRALIARKFPGNDAIVNEICERQGV